jgi:enamine deaminase RidA (YjgF/YER057c/UK114 family)
MSGRRTTILKSPSGASPGRLVEVGGLILSSSITGEDGGSGRFDPDAATQAAACFDNLGQALREAGSSWDEIGLVNASVTDVAHARVLERHWQALLLDAANRPVLKINEYALPPGQLVQLQAVGLRGQNRRPVESGGRSGSCGVGVRLGDLYFSAPIDGADPETGHLDDEPKAQMAQAFRNMERFAAAAGSGKGDLIHVLIFIRGREDQSDMLDAWLTAFPEDGNRPARKAIFDETLRREPQTILLMCVGVAGQGDRVNLEVPGISKRHPNPMGCRIGGFVFSSGVGGDDPAGKATGNAADVRAALAFRNMDTLLQQAGGTLDDIGLVSITVNGYADEQAILSKWRAVFPDPSDEPARHIMAFGGRGSYPVQLHVVANIGRH